MKKISDIVLLLAKMIVLVVFMLPVGRSYASDSTSREDSIIEVPKYLIASWYRGIDKEAYDNSKWYRNTSFTFNLNPEMMWDRARYDYNFFNFGFSLNKEFNPSSAVSVGFSFANSDKSDFNFRRTGGDIGYLWNLTNFYYGMDRTRRYSILTSTGLEFGSIKADDNYKKLYYGGYLGLRFNRTFSPHTSFFIEPRLGLYSDSYDAMTNKEGIDALVSTHLGLNYKLSEMLNIVKEKKSIRPLHMKNWFFEIGGDVLLPIPKIEYITESDYSDRINYGTSFGLGYRVNPLTAARGRFTYYKDNYTDTKNYLGAIDLVLSGTNIFLGENERRYVDMALALGPLFQLFKQPEDNKTHFNWGAETSLQFTRRITPTWELFVEPRLQLIQDYTNNENSDSNLKKRWDINAGMIYLYEKRIKQKFDEWSPLRNWYIQTLLGSQIESISSGHQIGSFDFSIGRNFGPLWSARASVFSGELKSNEPDFDESWNPMFVTYYGGRFEMVANLLRMFSPALEDSRWNLNISGGAEVGHLSNHYKKDIAVVAGSQLQYRFSRNGWITAGGRFEQPLKFDAKLPVSAHLGVQYDLKDNKRIDILENYWRWYYQGNIGFRNAFFNMDNFTYGAAVGLNFTPVHGGRIEFIGSKKNKSEDGTLYNWMSISPEYVFNLSNKVYGEDDNRKLDIEFLGGLDLMIHNSNFKNSKIGFAMGTQLNAYLNNSLALFVQPRFSIQPFDDIIAPTGHDKVQYLTLVGLRYIHNRYYTKTSEYRELLGDKQYEFFYNLRQRWNNWHPFQNFHPFNGLKEWHPMQNLHKIKMNDEPNRWVPLKKWYFQTTWSAQLASIPTGHQIGSFDFAIGRHINPLWDIQASVFSGELESNESDIDWFNNPMFVSYFGGRAELLFNYLRLFSPAIKDSRWNMNISGGLEMGHLTNHHKKDLAIVAGSQLQFRLTSNTWLSAGGRIEMLNKFDAKLPLSGVFGIHYNMNNERRIDILKNNWRWYVQGGTGFHNSFFNMDNIAYTGAVGININPVHGVRFEFIDRDHWKNISPEYVFNLSNKYLGEDDKRKVDVELFAGLDYMYKDKELGYNFGTQINANINKSISVFIQPRFSVQPSDKNVNTILNEKVMVQYFTLFGLRYSHNKFKSTKKKDPVINFDEFE